MKGTRAKGKRSGKINHIRCRRCGKRSYHVSKHVCSYCGYGKSARMRSYSWQKRRHGKKMVKQS